MPLASCREVSAAQLAIETIEAPVGKSHPALDLQTDIIFSDSGESKINRFLGYRK